MFPTFKVIWIFRNDHVWHKNFFTQNECYDFVNTTGLVSHPDIVRVTIIDGDNERDLKRVG